jgi:uncharacterized protein YggE
MRNIPGLMLVLFLISGAALMAQTSDIRTISVTGEGEITVDADRLSFYARIETKDKDIDQAKAINDQKLGKAEEIFKLFSIPANQIDISGYRVNPRYKNYPRSGSTELDGFYVSRRITIKLENIADYESLVDAIIVAGIYDIGGLQYSLSNSAEMHAKARENALNKAKQKAGQMATVYGMKLGKVVSIDEQNPGYRYSSFRAGSTSSNVASTNLTDMNADEVTGKIVFRAVVEVVYELKD